MDENFSLEFKKIIVLSNCFIWLEQKKFKAL